MACLLSRIQRQSNYFLYRKISSYLPTMASGKLYNSHFRAVLRPDLLRLERLFKSEGYSLRLVGGVVRDLLLGRNPKDIDLATECTPEEMVRLFEKEGLRYIPTGLQHGTITVHTDMGTDYEITTLRIDHVTDGRHALVQFTSDWAIDAKRRDLTINSMSLSFDGTLYDYFEGQRHLTEKKIVFVGSARSRIQEDYLRILRYFRFYGHVCDSTDCHDSDTLSAIRENAQGLANISVERVWMEMNRILVGQFAPHLVQLLYELGVAQYIALPIDGNFSELTKVWEKMYDCYLLEPVSLLVTLMRSEDEAEKMSRNWKLSNAERKLGIFVVRQRENCYGGSPLKYYQDLLVDGNPKAHVLELLRYCGRVKESVELDIWKIPVCPVNGHDLLEAGVINGPLFGRTLRDIKNKWKESYFTLSKEELLPK